MSISSQHHSFDIALAAQFGIEEAIIIHHFQHWIRINKMAKRNFKEGRTWTYQSRKEISYHLPYMNFDRVRRICESLEEKEVIIKSNYNRSGFDKTTWYAFKDEKAFKVDEASIKEMFTMGKIAHGVGKIAQPIPDPIPDPKAKTKISTHSAGAEALCKFFHSELLKRKPNFSGVIGKSWYAYADKLLKLRSPEEIRKVIDWLLEDPFWSGVVLSPQSLHKNIDKIEMQMVKKPALGGSRVTVLTENGQLANKLKKILGHRMDLDFGLDSIGFVIGVNNYVVVNYKDNSFKEQVFNNFRKLKIDVNALLKKIEETDE